jgi:thiol-disulfide isomerase/thioredoxin
MHPIISELEQLCPSGLISRVSVDHATGRSLAQHYGVTLVPTFVSIDAEGREVERIVGEQPKQRLLLALSEINGAPCDAQL